MPYKLKNPYRHKFEKAKYKITNWPEYNNALKQRGNINIWFQPNVKEQWYYKKPKNANRGRQKTYSDFAIFTMRTLGSIYKQRLRQTEGFVKSIIKLMDIDLNIPDYTTLSRRTEDLEVSNLSNMLDSSEVVNVIIDATGLKIFGIGEWQECKYNLNKRKGWRKLNIAIDRKSQKILSSELTTNNDADHTPVPELLNEINNKIASVSGDCAYDCKPVYESILKVNARAIIPPKENAVISRECLKYYPTRADNINLIAEIGKQKWQKESGYNYRSLVETAMYRYKMIVSDKVYSKKIVNQNVESKIGCYILNKMVDLGMPISVKKAA